MAWGLRDRRTMRLPGRNYAEGMFFVTLCTHDRGALFGEIADGRMCLNRFGAIATESVAVAPNAVHSRHTGRLVPDARPSARPADAAPHGVRNGGLRRGVRENHSAA